MAWGCIVGGSVLYDSIAVATCLALLQVQQHPASDITPPPGQEAVKLYGNEAAEEQRFDRILRSIAATSLRSALVGSVLNAGQARP